MPKVTIIRRPAFRWEGVKEAAQALGVSRTAVNLYLAGRTSTLSKEKRDRIVIRTVTKKGSK